MTSSACRRAPPSTAPSTSDEDPQEDARRSERDAEWARGRLEVGARHSPDRVEYKRVGPHQAPAIARSSWTRAHASKRHRWRRDALLTESNVPRLGTAGPGRRRGTASSLYALASVPTDASRTQSWTGSSVRSHDRPPGARAPRRSSPFEG